MVTALGYGTTGLSVGQRVFGLTDWTRDGTLAEYAAVEARNLAPLPGDIDFTVGASLPISGLTAWQGLIVHGRLQAGQRVIAHGAAGAVGSMVTQLAREFGAYVIGTGRAADRQPALDFGANAGNTVDSPIDFATTRGRRMAGSNNGGARAGNQNTPQPATPRQIKFIQAIAREHGIADEQLNAEVEQLYGKPVVQLDRRDASAYIERLQTRRNVTELGS